MPELPEVETVRQGLIAILPKAATIARIDLRRGDLRQTVSAEELRALSGQPILGIRRRAKYLLIETPKYVLLSHLGMTGSWRVVAAGEERPHDHLFLEFSNGLRLAFNDPRRFGLAKVLRRGEESRHKLLRHLGPEPLDVNNFTAHWVMERTRRRKVAVKLWLMDQRNVVGVGNIYASEALHRAGIKPSRPAGSLKPVEAGRMVRAVREVLELAIRQGGTTIRDFRQAAGSAGYFQSQLKVYDRAGKRCYCGDGTIVRRVMVGRSTFWCPACQK